jgi:dimethylargininase
MSDLVALTREASPAIARCELTHLSRVPIDLDKARTQHEDYERALTALGCTVHRLPSGPEMPDSVFIEDVAIVLDELAIVARPGAPSRRVECAAVEDGLAPYRTTVVRIEPPGTLDGGDVLVVGRSIFIGISSRTNDAAVEQVRTRVAPFGYSVQAVSVTGCLHLKSAVTAAGDNVLLMNRAWAPVDLFRTFDIIDVHPDEPYAANVVRVGDGLLYPTAFPRTRDRLETRGFRVTAVDVSELAKAEGAVTCCSLIFTGGAFYGSET